jgi:hypothetical protein
VEKAVKTQVNPIVAAVVVLIVLAVVVYFFVVRTGPPKTNGEEGGGLSSLGRNLDPNALMRLSEEDKRKFREQMEQARQQRLAHPP